MKILNSIIKANLMRSTLSSDRKEDSTTLIKHTRILLSILYLLNCTDILFTLMFSSTGYFIELNPFMKRIIADPTLSFLLKMIVPAILFVLLAFRIKTASKAQLRIVKRSFEIMSAVYIVINLMHIGTLLVFVSNSII